MRLHAVGIERAHSRDRAYIIWLIEILVGFFSLQEETGSHRLSPNCKVAISRCRFPNNAASMQAAMIDSERSWLPMVRNRRCPSMPCVLESASVCSDGKRWSAANAG